MTKLQLWKCGYIRLALLLIAGSSAVAPAARIPPLPDFFDAGHKAPIAEYQSVLMENTATHEGYMATLNEKYIRALENAKERMEKLRAARAAKALESEIDRIKAGDTSRSEEIDAAPDYVREMRGQYEQFIVRVNNVRRSRDGEAKFELDQAMVALQIELTKADQIDRAVAVREFRRALANPQPEEPEEVVVEVTPPAPDPVRPPVRPRLPDPGRPPEVKPPPRPKPSFTYEEYDDPGIPRPMTAEEKSKYATVLAAAPARSGRGYSAMIASIQKGDVTEINLSKIKSWGKARPQIWNEKPVWTATVTYPTISLFGTFDTEGMAIMDGGKVVEWLYTGSGEEIP